MCSTIEGATSVTLLPPESQVVRFRDVVWCEALLKAMGDGIIDSRQVEKILRVFNLVRPDR